MGHIRVCKHKHKLCCMTQGFLKKALVDRLSAAMAAEDAADKLGGGKVPAYEVRRLCSCCGGVRPAAVCRW